MNQDQSIIAVISSFTPKQCGIATYTSDLIASLQNKYSENINYKIFAVDEDPLKYKNQFLVQRNLNSSSDDEYHQITEEINQDPQTKLVLIQHEFGLFHQNEPGFMFLLKEITKPIIIVFHTVIPNPDKTLYAKVRIIAKSVDRIVVMTHKSQHILEKDYHLKIDKIEIIPHGIHKTIPKNKDVLKKKYHLSGKKILSTFGLLGPGKSIETTIQALPEIVKVHPDVHFLILGKTHPELLKKEGEKYRYFLKDLIVSHQLEDHITFVNEFLDLNKLLEYLQLTDIYLFTSKDPNQAVSGTFSYALSCGCAILATPIPHAVEVMEQEVGKLFDFGDYKALSKSVIQLLNEPQIIENYSLNALHISSSQTWENSAIAHMKLFQEVTENKLNPQFSIPEPNMDHIYKLTTDFGMLQFCHLTTPDIDYGYTLDDNSRAFLVALEFYIQNKDIKILPLIQTYLNFILLCHQEKAYFLNYIDYNQQFSERNQNDNLEDAGGRAIWALSTFLRDVDQLPDIFSDHVPAVEQCIHSVIDDYKNITSPRAMGFIIKGLSIINLNTSLVKSKDLILNIINHYSNALVELYHHHSTSDWEWFEPYLTYANAILPEAMLKAGHILKDEYKTTIAKKTIHFLLKHILKLEHMTLIGNKSWFDKGNIEYSRKEGEQPIDAAYTVLALEQFASVCPDHKFYEKAKNCFDWFLGNNEINQEVYNDYTGGCYDGIEKKTVNLNQGAESTVSFHLARQSMNRLNKTNRKKRRPIREKTSI